jgi:hypothetical protein
MKRVNIYAVIREMREQIVKTMQERGIKELATCMSYAEWCKENKCEPEEDETDDTDYLDYKDQECPYCVFIHKYDMNDYRIDKVTLEGDRFKFEGFCNELGYDWQWEDDTVWATRMFVWERLADLLGIEDEPEKVYVFTAEQAWDGDTADIIVKTFRTREAAREFMHKFIHEDGDESIEDYVKRKDWYVEIDEPDLYRACEYGRYSTDHIEITITECNIE